MFENITEYVLWDLMPEAVKQADESTPKMLYDGEERGQTQRYLIALGRLILDLFDKIEKSFSSRDPFLTDASNLIHLQNEFFARFMSVAENTGTVRNILESIVDAWRLKGTEVMLRWIIYKVYGWELVNISTLARKALFSNTITSTSYDGVSSLEDSSVVFDPDIMASDLNNTRLDIDVKGDPEFADKSSSLEDLIGYWTYNTNIFYINTP